jgi:hypothetical protein
VWNMTCNIFQKVSQYWAIPAAGSTSQSAVEDATHERIRPPVQLRDPFIGGWARDAVAGFDRSILPDADTDQPGWTTKPEALTLPSSLHHPWYAAKVATLRA